MDNVELHKAQIALSLQQQCTSALVAELAAERCKVEELMAKVAVLTPKASLEPTG